ncbi:KR domain-containing protein, partial [Kitasatospora sp. NPDC004799]|uniref:KR domain-containing protein n=1 Tax=Kitasatospora sp. NPDC004799 TaxID=3154460 RepID=UPI0033B58190
MPWPGGPAGRADDWFWDAVEQEDLQSLADALDSGDETLRTSLCAVLPVLSSWRRRRAVESTIDGWRYQVEWKPAAAAPGAVLSGEWLVVAEDATAGLVEACASVLSGHGASVRRVVSAGLSRAELAAAVAGSPVAGVLAVVSGAESALTLVQALGDAAVAAPLWLVTSGAVSTGRADRVRDAGLAQVWGLGRVVALEHPERWGGLVDVPETLDERARGRLAAVLAGLEDEDQVAVRASGVFVRRLVRASGAVAEAWTPRGTVLVTGGTGALGAHVARWLAGGGAEHVVLTSRRGPDAPGAVELRDELENAARNSPPPSTGLATDGFTAGRWKAKTSP